jgi:hypothetical protein
MPDTNQTFSAATVIEAIFLGMLLGGIGQGIRVIVGLKKASDSAQASGSTLKDQFDGAKLVVSLFIGAVAGALASLPLMSQLANLTYQTCIALMGAGYAGADFIEGFITKVLPTSGIPTPLPTSPTPPAQPNLTPLKEPLLVAAALSADAATIGIHKVLASSFADPDDVAKFKACKTEGHSDNFCFNYGDNGIGFMGDDCTTSTPMCALPVEDWMGRWGSKEQARLKPVLVSANGQSVECLMGDTMPTKAKITNGAGIDLSPAAVAALGLKPPLMIPASWQWADDATPIV